MILFSDFDGTFWLEDSEARSRANFEAVKRWREMGHRFCVTTGRSYKSVSNRFPKIRDICDRYIVDGGSIILSRTGEVSQAFYFNPEIVHGIVRFSEGLPEEPVVFYYTSDSENTIHKENGVTKLRLWFKDPSLLEEVTEQVKKSFPVFAFRQDGVSHYKELDGQKGFVEIVPIDCGKSNAIKVLQRSEGIPVKDIITVGDGLNDYDMVRDFNGFAIEGSNLSKVKEELNVTASVSALIDKILN